MTCFQYLKKIMYEHILRIHPFHTCAVVTEQITSPRCALIILLKALITSPVKVRRPLSAKTSKEGGKKDNTCLSKILHFSICSEQSAAFVLHQFKVNSVGFCQVLPSNTYLPLIKSKFTSIAH